MDITRRFGRRILGSNPGRGAIATIMVLTIVLLLISLLLLTILGLYLVFLVDSVVGGSDLPTSRKAIKAVVLILTQYPLTGPLFFDLGCGHGAVVLGIKKKVPTFSVCGVDKNGIRLFFAFLKSKLLQRKITLLRQDIFATDLSSADMIYAYLERDLMPLLERKLRRELKPGALVITNTTFLPEWQRLATRIVHPQKPEFEKLFIYRQEKSL